MNRPDKSFIADNSETDNSLPFLTAQFEGIGGIIKMRDEDFVVEEIPLCKPDGQGEHIYALIEKNGISTMDAMADIARALRITRKEIGFAGLKDARAVARQWISIENIEPEKLGALKIANVRILQVDKHSEKLKSGGLAGNRFVVRLRKVNLPVKQAVTVAEKIISELLGRGAPNYFGPQRFGQRNDNHLLGETVAKGKVEQFADIFLGGSEKQDSPVISQARRFYEQGDYKKAHDSWPYVYADQRRALKALTKKNGSKKHAYHSVDKYLKGFFVSAYQSYLFNRFLALRMPDIDKVLAGDIAYNHISREFFRIENPSAENPRCQAFEISPTGPLFGLRMTKSAGPAGEIENRILENAGLNGRDLRQMSEYGAGGVRRPLRFRPHNAKISAGDDKYGSYVELRFELDSGCYATCFLREICKTGL
ncbi:MAG: tRNA pseudouridine(13) synthase TruD [Phycisphaerae bacterium]|nr:tRNA pseudouridine(13) synthase TruD [Phycisphaerae bacterium]